MTVRVLRAREIAVAACLLLAFGCASAQSTKKCKAGSKDPACTTDPSPSNPTQEKPTDKSASDVFAFPTEDSRHGGDVEGETTAAPAKSAAPSNGLPALPTGPDANPPASSERPLHLPPGSSSSSSSSSADGSSNRTEDDDADVAPTTAAPDAPVKASALKDLGSRGDTSAARLKLEKTRVADDLKVGKFYLQDGNLQGAYLRYKDAVDHAPDDPDARFGLAASADRLKKKDEAVLNYREYLKLDSEGDHDAESRRALAKLGASAE